MESRKRLIDANAIDYENIWCTQHELWRLYNFIQAQPTVDAEETVFGRWIDRPNIKGQVYCSECATIEKSTDNNYKSNRCPNCGAKMYK